MESQSVSLVLSVGIGRFAAFRKVLLIILGSLLCILEALLQNIYLVKQDLIKYLLVTTNFKKHLVY